MVSDRFLPAHPKTLATIASPVPVIVGLNSMEGIIALSGDYIFNLIISIIIKLIYLCEHF